MKFLVLTINLQEGGNSEEWLTPIEIYAKYGYAVTVADVNEELLPITIHKTHMIKVTIISYK